MKSIFTKLSTLLLCGVVAMVGCTDFSEDIQAVDKKVDDLTASTQTELASLKSAITDLEAKLAAQYATKDEVAALKTALENSIASEVDALSKDIADVNAALKAAEDKINGAIADLDDKKADKTAVDAAIKTATEAIAALQSQLEAAKGELEAEIDEVKAEIATTEEELAAQIGAVDAKANELQNTLLALSDYLANLEAKVNELKGTLDALSEYLPKMKAELEEKINAVDAKAIENYNTLLALSDHLAEYEATTDFKLVELQGSLAALSVYLEEYEASVDAKFKEILNTFDSLDGFLDEKFATLDATDTDLYNEINGIREAFTTLNNLLEDEVKARQEADEALYTKISEEVALQIEAMQEYFTQLYNRVVDLEAADEAIYVEMENIRTYVAQVYNSLSYEIKAVDAALKAHVAAFEAYKAQMQETIESLYANDSSIAESVADHTRKILKYVDEKVAELQAQDDELWTKVFEVEESLSQAMNYLLTEMDDRDNALYAKVSEDIQTAYGELNSMIELTQEALTVALKDIEDLFEKVQTNAAAIAKLETAVEILNSWAEAHQEEYNDLVQLVAKHVADLTAQIEALNEKDLELEYNIGETSKALSALIEDTEKRFGQIEAYMKENFDLQGAAIRNLENILNDLSAELGARLDALEERVDNIEIDIDALEKALADLETALENGLAETLYLAYKNDEGVMGNVKAFEDKVSALVEELRNADGKIREDFAAELADILVRLASIDTELAEIAEWQTSVNTTLGQLSSQIYEAIGLAETQLKKDIEEAVALLKAEDAKIREEIEAGLAETLYLAYKNDEGVMDNVRAFEEKMDNIVKALQSQINDLLARVQSIVLVPEYNDGKATIHFASLDGYPIIGPSVLKYRVQAVKGEDAASISEALVKAWENNPDALQYHVVPVKERTRNAQPEATLSIEDVKAEDDFIYVTVRPADFDGAFYTSVMDQKSNVEALVDGLFSRTTSYSAAIIFTDGVNNVTSEYYNLYPEATEVTMKIVIPDEEGTVKDITNVLPGEERQKLAYTDVETSKAILAGHDLLFTVNGEDYTKDALVKEFGYDINIRHITVLSYTGKGFEDNVDTINLNYGVTGNNVTVVYGNDEDVNFVIYPGKDCTVKLAEPLAKEQVGNVLTFSYEYTVNDAVSVQTSSEVEITHEIVNVTFEEVTIPWSLKLANELRGGEDKDFAPYYKSYTTDAIKHDCPYDLGTMLTSISKAGELEKVIKVNGKKVGEYVTIPRTDYDDANRTARIKFQSGSPKFSAEGPTKYEIVYHGIYNNQYDVTATAIVVFEQIPSFEITSDVTLASQKGWFVGDDALVKDGILDKNLAADLGYETAADALNQLYAAYTDAASTKATEITFGGKTIKGSRGNGNVQLNVTENHDLTKVYLYNGDVEELLGKAQLEDDSVFAIKHTITTWTGAKVVYTINAKTDLPDYVLSTDPVRVKNDIVEVKGEIVNEEYTVDVADLAKYYYIFNEGLETLEAPKTNVPELEVEFTLAGQKDAEGFYIKDDIYNFPVKFENKGLLDMNTAVVNWGTYPYTEIVVNATLKANGYPIDSKPITLVTKDPLHILFEDVDVTVDHKAGTNDEPVVAKVYHNFNITSDVEPEAGNLCNIDAKTIAGLFWYSHADKTYGIEVETEVLQVYYEENGVRKNWDREKYTIGYRVNDNGEYILNEDGEKIFDGNIYINADDAGILVPIKAEVGVRVSHRIHAASPVCVNEGTITVTFNPAE